MTLIPAALREAVVQRAGNRCEYCCLSQVTQVATFPVDHILPVTLEGETTLANLALACPRCNAGKWTRVNSPDPVSGETLSLFNPRTQAWADHFRWSESDLAVLEPLTPTGRATLALLDLHGARHIEVRRLLIVLRLHPPTATTTDTAQPASE
jgi:hypothetical protein